MAKKITQEQIIQSDIWENSIKSTKELISQVEILENELKKVSQASSKIIKESNKPTFENLKKVDEETKKLNATFEQQLILEKEKIKLEQQEIALQKQLSQERQREAREKERIRKLAEKQKQSSFDEREALRKLNLEKRQTARLNATQIGTIENLRARLALVTNAWTKLTAVEIENTKRGQRLNESKKQLTAQLKKLESATGDNRREVGNYGKGLEGLKNKFRSLAGALGIGLGINALRNFSSELILLNNESKGVQFAFDRLGERGVDAFNRIKKSTRGLLSDLEIKRSINEFDNFNLSLEQSDVLFEFLAVTSAQTGKSVDKLKESLVEGLSKESKLRIDNLGISMAELNDELDKAPSFIDAVANIAKKRIAVAGNILDEAGNSQEKWNASIQNTKELLAKQLQPVFDEVFKNGAIGLKFISDNLSTLLSILSFAIKSFVTYKAVTLSSALANKVMALSFVKLGAQIGGLNGIIAGVSGAFKSLGKTLKNNAFGLVLLALTEIYKSLNLVVSATSRFKDIQEDLSEASTNTSVSLEREKLGLKALIDNLKKTTNGTKDREIALNDLNRKYGTTLKNITDETEFLRLLDIEQKKILSNIENKLNLQEKEQEFNLYSTEIVKTELEQTKLRNKITEAWGQNAFTEFLQGFGDYENTKSILGQQFKENEKLLSNLKQKKQEAKRELSELLSLQAKSQIAENTNEPANTNSLTTNSKKDIEKTAEELKIDYKERANNLKDYLEERAKIIRDAENAVMPDEEQTAPLVDETYEAYIADLEAKQKALEEAKEKKRLKEIENRKKTLATLESLNRKYFDDKKNQVEDEIEQARERESNLQSLANNGNEEAVKSLAENQKQQAEANKKKEDLIQREKQFETALALIQAYNTALDGGKSNGEALAEAVTSISVLTSLASSLPSFYDGTENTGTVANPLDGNGGRIAILHNNERVLTEKQNKMIGDYSNEDVANTMFKLDKGLLTDVTSINTPHLEVKNTRFESNEAILNKFNSLEKSIVSAIENKETYLGSDVDTVKQIMKQYYKKNGTKQIVNSKSKIW